MENDAETQLLQWYTKIWPVRVDIVGDFAGKELFAIHGDSLLLHCLTEDKVDVNDGFQLLHAVHAVERLLSQLQARGCNFHVLWFDDHEHLATPAAEPNDNISLYYRLARIIIIEHFRRHAADFVFEFDSIDGHDFQQYLLHNAVHFFLCLDSLDIQGGMTANVVQYRSIMHKLSSSGYSIALINNIEFVSSKVYAWVFSPRPELDNAPGVENKLEALPELMCSLDAIPHDWTPWESKEPLSARDALALIGLCNTLLRDSSAKSKALAASFIAHLCILRRCSLAERSCGVTSLDADELAHFKAFLANFSTSCIEAVKQLPKELHWDAFDLIDGRILRQIYKRLSTLKLPVSLAAEAREFAQQIHQMTKIDISTLIPSGQAVEDMKPKQTLDSQKTSHKASILPFDHPVLNKFLKSIEVETEESDEPAYVSKVFQEVSHWHNAKTSIDPKQLPAKKGFYARKRDQIWMADTVAYSASLTNASGKMITPETIISHPANYGSEKAKGAHKKEVEAKPKHKVVQPKAKEKKNAPKSGRQKALEEAQRIKQGKENEKASAIIFAWEERCKELEEDLDLKRRYTKALRFLSNLSKLDKTVIGAEVSLYVCNVLTKLIQNGRKRKETETELGLLAMLWSRVLETAEMPMSKDCFAQLERLAKMVYVKLPARRDVSATSDDSGNATKPRALPFRSSIRTNNDVKLSMDPLQFQLEHCGPYLERGFDPAPDARVPSFEPDAWQRDVLDAIDANKSLFVVAPTSAGKTFISFYAMKTVLQSSDDGILVYVAPTKALVNQIAAEVQARFSKSYVHDGRSVWAIHTRDYRVNNPKGCQVLVTVPHILQIMLLATSNAERANSWSLRIKRIIFDEVHCIGQSEDGVIWEQLLLLAPCPIIALSATVGNPLEFKAWLEESEKVKGLELAMIVHSSRFSDLRKFIYEPPRDSFTFRGLKPLQGLAIPGLDEGSKGASRFTFIHPVASLVNCNRGHLDDISLEPRDCLMLWRCMSKHQTQAFSLPDTLGPQHMFKETATKADVVRWERALKEVLLVWMKDKRSPFSTMRKHLLSASESVSDAGRGKVADPEHDNFSIDFLVSEKSLRTTALPLLEDLNNRGALPAILFNYDRLYCESTLFTLVEQLERAETQWKESSPQWKQKMKDYEQWKRSNANGNKLAKKEKPRPGQSKLDMVREEASKESSPWASFNPDAPLDLFSFANRTKLLETEFENHIRHLAFVNLDERFIPALRRGIAVHHAGMNRAYRQVVEILFRKGFLTVVVATGTLALGLNMPCKTVVFFGDSIYLSTLNYLQAAGRAGRRGFDVLGNVVFTGMPRDRALDIMSSRLPDLRGHFPLSTTLILRLLGLLHSTNNSAYATNATVSLLSQTRLYLGGPADQMAICHHVRFSIEYLQRQHLLSRHGTPLNLSGLVGHLYFTENAVFAFHSLLAKGYLHELCAGIHQRPMQVMVELMLVLSHIFCRIPVRWRAAPPPDRHSSPSLVVLPPLPRAAEEILVGHNKETLDIFKTYVATFVEQHLADTPDDCLPLSGVRVGGGAPCAGGEESGGSVRVGGESGVSVLLDHLPPTQLRSPFGALSGLTDEFPSIHALCTTVRRGVCLEESSVPYIRIFPRDTAGVPWNAYLYDFFKHGDLQALVRDNGIKRGDVWFLLKDFSLVIATIVTSLTNFLTLDDTGDDDADIANVQDVEDMLVEKRDGMVLEAAEATKKKIQAGGEQVDKEWNKEWNKEGNKEGNKESSAGKKNKVVADAWDDESDEDPLPQTSRRPSTTSCSAASTAWHNEGESLKLVLLAFAKLRDEFDTKFRNVWA